ncbi:MAG: NAD-dependent epimerase/dehydratase family protein, partial [Gammaproteobacteria bacterium]
KSASITREYREVNTYGTLNLARQAAASGVKRFIYVSSVKVNGEKTRCGESISTDWEPNPIDLYGVSKYESDKLLIEVSNETGMELVIVRPPLVYGPGVKGNFLSLLRWLDRGMPLPLGSIHNQRSLVGIDNLVDLIITCLDHPAAANQTFLVSDDEDLSTTELLQRLGKILNKPARLIPIPPVVLEWGASFFGKKEIAQRLLGNLQVDISKTKRLLDWSPLVSVDEGLKNTMEWYMRQR